MNKLPSTLSRLGRSLIHLVWRIKVLCEKEFQAINEGENDRGGVYLGACRPYDGQKAVPWVGRVAIVGRVGLIESISFVLA